MIRGNHSVVRLMIQHWAFCLLQNGILYCFKFVPIWMTEVSFRLQHRKLLAQYFSYKAKLAYLHNVWKNLLKGYKKAAHQSNRAKAHE